eukprot:scaffold1035_cov374-Prasinococcus_capsulatus_cf.AAC.3
MLVLVLSRKLRGHERLERASEMHVPAARRRVQAVMWCVGLQGQGSEHHATLRRGRSAASSVIAPQQRPTQAMATADAHRPRSRE